MGRMVIVEWGMESARCSRFSRDRSYLAGRGKLGKKKLLFLRLPKGGGGARNYTYCLVRGNMQLK